MNVYAVRNERSGRWCVGTARTPRWGKTERRRLWTTLEGVEAWLERANRLQYRPEVVEIVEFKLTGEKVVG